MRSLSRILRSFLAVLATISLCSLSVFAGCSDDDGAPPADAGMDAQVDAELMGEAAKLQSPRIVLSGPEPNGRSSDTNPEPP